MPANSDVQDKRLLRILPNGAKLYGAWVRRQGEWVWETWTEGGPIE